jgi:hypothetical protein
MNRFEFLPYREKPCKFRLKSGKEVFGVILEKVINDNPAYFFATAVEHERYVHSNERRNDLDEIAVPVLLEDIIRIEPISSD